uniref:Putative tail protein n=1 Tax=viral metagenome TaxID=1070528 RepID=A0A6M3KG78_9ZZZZ
MAKVTLRNVFEDTSEFETIDEVTVLKSVIEYARTKNDEIYKTVMNEKVKIFLNGKLLPIEEWAEETTQDDKIIIVPSLEGGIVQLLLGTAMLVVGFITGWTPLMYIGASLMLGGMSNLMFAPDLPSLLSKGSTETQTYSWSGIKTIARQDTPLPVVFGTHDIGGNVISLFTEAYGEDNYLYMLLGLCEGEIDGICKETDSTSVCQTSDTAHASYTDPAIKFDNQYLSRYSDIDWWYRTGINTTGSENAHYPFEQNKIPNFDGARLQYDDGREITSDGIEYTTTRAVDMLVLQIRAPALYKLNDTGDIDPYTVNYTLEYKEAGGTYSTYDIEKWATLVSAGASGTNPSFCTVAYKTGTYRYGTKLKTYKIEVLDNTFTPFEYSSGAISTVKYADIVKDYVITINILDENNNIIERGKKLHQSATQSWSYYGNFGGRTDDDSGPDWYDVAVYNQNTIFYINDYRVQLSHNTPIGSIFTISSSSQGTVTEVPITGKSKTGLWSSVTLDLNALSVGSDIYTIKISRTDGGKSSSFKTEDNVILESVTEVVQGTFIYPNTALLGLKIKATGQLSGAPPNIVTTVRGKKVSVPDLEDASPTGTDVTFDSAFWDATDSRWEDSDGNEVFWNDTTSWRTEYSENSMCCVRDLALSNRYGLGAYWSTADLNNTSIVTNLKLCHVVYNPYGATDYFDWWDDVSDTTWRSKWAFLPYGNNSTVAKTFDATNRTITLNGSSTSSTESIFFRFLLNTELLKSQTYTLSMTFANVTGNFDIYVYGKTSYSLTTDATEYFGTLAVTSAGTKSFTISSVKKVGIKSLEIKFAGNPTTLDVRIDDVSLTRPSSEHFHTYNGVLESEQSAMTALLEMCESFRTWPIWYNGIINFVMNTDSTPVHSLSIGNTFNFTQSFTPLSDIPYTLIGQFTDENDTYTLKQMASKATASKGLNRTNKRTIGLKGLTSTHKAERELIFKHNNLLNANHAIHIECGPDIVHAIAGDIVYIQDELPQWGQGGRILSYIATNITIDKKYTFSNAATADHIIRYQIEGNTFVNATVDKTNIVTNASLLTIPIITLASSPCDDAVYSIGVNTSDFKKFRLINVNRKTDDTMEIDAINHVASIYTNPTIKIIENNQSNLNKLTMKPEPPRNVTILPTPLTMGLGCIFKADPPLGDTNVKEIVVQIDRSSSYNYETIAIIPLDQRQAYYLDNKLVFDKTYMFRFFCRTNYKQSDPIDVSFKLNKSAYLLAPPSGITIKGSSNVKEFDGRDITLIWNKAGQSTYSDSFIAGYEVEVYHTSITRSNLLRTESVSTEEYTYTLEKNRDDCWAHNLSGTYNTTLYFIVKTVGINEVVSLGSKPFVVDSATPAKPANLTSSPAIGGMSFSWDQNTALSFDRFSYRYKISVAGTYTSWYVTKSNSITLNVADSDVTTYGKNATMYFQVKSLSYVALESSVASISDVYNTLADSIFQISGVTDGTGNVASLYDGNKTSGGVSF